MDENNRMNDTSNLPPATGQNEEMNGQASSNGYGAPPQGQVLGGYAPPPGYPAMPQPYAVATGAPLAVPAAVAKAERQPFTTTRADSIFAIACFVLGFFAIRWLLPLQGWTVTAFTVLFAGIVLGYAKAKSVKAPRASWWWLAMTLLFSVGYALWPQGQLMVWQSLLLCGVASWWCACLFNVRMRGKTDNWLGLDVINLLFITPFRNYDTQVLGLGRLWPKKINREKFGKRLLGVVIGLAVVLFLLAILVPMLLSADSVYFGLALQGIVDFFVKGEFMRMLVQEGGIVLLQLILGVPIAWYLCGMMAGGAHKRYAKNIPVTGTHKFFDSARIAPQSTIVIVLCAVSALYVFFISCQIPYYFKAFEGIKPAEFQTYSQYAREGFFELCRVVAINLGLLALANTLARRPTKENLPLKVLNIALCLLTLLIVVTAFSKMALYIAMHGLTPKRIITSVFMIFLALVCVAAIVRQFAAFSVVRLAAVVGSGLFCALCLCNLNGLVASYNARQYQAGNLDNYDPLMVYISGAAAVPSAMEVYGQMEEGDERDMLAWVISEAVDKAENSAGTGRDTVTNASVRAMGLSFDEETLESGQELFYANYPRRQWASLM